MAGSPDPRWLPEDDFAGEFGKIEVPTLIVWGDRDALLPRGEQESDAAAIKDSQLVVYEGTGHALHLEEPGRTTFGSHVIRHRPRDTEPPIGRSNTMFVEKKQVTFRRYIEEVWKDREPRHR